jgi:hypothetical protein
VNDVVLQQGKKRVLIMGAIVALATVVAMAAATGAFLFGHRWLVWVFAAALVAGVGAQIWFIVGLRPTKKGV